MADFFRTSLSGLLAFQRALDVTSHNIANVNTPGYSRQIVELGTRPAQPYGNGWVGSGVAVTTTRRMFDEFLALQSRSSSSSLQHLDVYARSAERLSNLFGNSTTGLTAALQSFVNAFQGVANAPTSVPARQVLLGEAQTLQQRLRDFESQFAAMDAEINFKLQGEVAEINAIARSLADLNHQITVGYGRSGGQPPNDLLDQRDRLLDKLAEKVSITTVAQDGGAVNVFIGNGQPLVLGENANVLAAVPSEFDANRLEIAFRGVNGSVNITENIRGGLLGGLLDFRREQLDPAHNSLGRMSLALVEIVNEQHVRGADLAGERGQAFFAIGRPEAIPSSFNTGSSAVTASIVDVEALTQKDYVLEYSGGAWQLRDARTGAPVPMTGSGTAADPFVAEGVAFEVSGAPAEGDRFMLRPTRSVVSGLQVLVNDPSKVAAGALLTTGVGADNLGAGAISEAEIIDLDALDTQPVTIEFTGPNTYSINGGPPITFAGSPIDITHNGWRVTITGTPAQGDVFTVGPSGAGDNRNALLLAEALQRPILNGGTTSLSAAVGQFVGDIGVAAKQAQVNRDAQAVVHEENLASRDSVSGVNLDEEAANLLKFQQAYQAAAQLIRVADTLFQTLLGATQR